MSLGSGVIPAWIFDRAPRKPCFICKHKATAHREDVGCIGPNSPVPIEDAEDFYAGTCKKGCKRYIKDNLQYLQWKYEQKKKLK